MSKYTIRRATQSDVEFLVEFNYNLAKETEGKELDRELLTRGVSRAFEQGDEAIYFVAVPAGDEEESTAEEAVGSLMLTREWSDWRDGWIAWIQSVYVSKEHRGAKVFRSMLNHATEELKKNPDVRGLRLYVENENTRAQGVYQRCGFENPNYQVLEKLF